MFKYLAYLFISFVLSSCIMNKDLDIFISETDAELEVFDFDYKLSEGDLLFVEIKSITPSEYDFFNSTRIENYSSSQNNPYLLGYLVNDSGYIDLPTLGLVFLKGKTIEEAQNNIKDVAKNYFVDPFVKLVHLNFSVTVLGEVNDPGRFQVSHPKTTILEMIGEANGFTSVANRKRVKIIRTIGEKPLIYYLDLSNKSTSNSDLFFACRGDVISVEPHEKKFFAVNNFSQLFSILVSSMSFYLLLNQSE